MNKIVSMSLMLLVSSAAVASNCNVEDGPYFSFGAGLTKAQRWKGNLNQPGTHFKTGSSFRMAVGSQFSAWRAEFEPSFFRAKYTQASNNGHVRLASTLGNLYAGLPFGSIFNYPVSPYLGAGIGFSSVKGNFYGAQMQPTSGHQTVLAYQGIVGVRFALNDQSGLNIEYRYFATEKLNVGRRLASHSANVGVSYKF